MKKTIKIILISSGLYGISIGIFDFLFPVYLDYIKISFKNMGWIFAISFIFIFFFRIYLGHISDFIGRKLFYGLSLITGAISQNLSPLFTSFFPLTLLKTIREISVATRENFQPVVVYEAGKEKFLDFIAKTNGIGLFLEGIGILIAGYLLIKMNVKLSLFLSAVPTWIAVFVFYSFYKEKFTPLKERNFSPKNIMGKMENKELKKIVIISFLITSTVFISHSFFLPLYFIKKFNVSPFIIGIILSFHRLTFGIPMFFAGRIIKRNHKKIFFYSVIFQGITIAATVFMPNFILAAIVFLLHDIGGASIWSPIYNSYIQKFSGEKSRGKDTSTVFAFTSLGKIIGPIIAGYVAGININLPFFLSGIGMALSSIPIIFLPELETEKF